MQPFSTVRRAFLAGKRECVLSSWQTVVPVQRSRPPADSAVLFCLIGSAKIHPCDINTTHRGAFCLFNRFRRMRHTVTDELRKRQRGSAELSASSLSVVVWTVVLQPFRILVGECGPLSPRVFCTIQQQLPQRD